MSERAPIKAGGIIRTSLDNTWKTPEYILERVRRYFDGAIPLDPATAPDNPTKALRYCCQPGSEPFDSGQTMLFEEPEPEVESENLGCGLTAAWDWPWWCNPPYGKNLKLWLSKMIAESGRREDVEGIAIVPCTRWEQRYMTDFLAASGLVCWMQNAGPGKDGQPKKGRVAFISARDGLPVSGNPFASMILGFNAELDRFVEAFTPLGACFELGRAE